MKKGLFILLAIIAMTACSKGPEKAAKNFTENMAKGDITEAKKYATTSTGSLLDMMSGFMANMPKYPDYKFEMLKDSIIGDTAWVFYKNTEGQDSELTLLKENNEWKVSMGK